MGFFKYSNLTCTTLVLIIQTLVTQKRIPPTLKWMLDPERKGRDKNRIQNEFLVNQFAGRFRHSNYLKLTSFIHGYYLPHKIEITSSAPTHLTVPDKRSCARPPSDIQRLKLVCHRMRWCLFRMDHEKKVFFGSQKQGQGWVAETKSAYVEPICWTLPTYLFS